MSLIAVLTALPMLASAITIQPADFYNDVRASSPEAAGINLLTRENIVRGYGSRQFGPTRVINRAEFLKVAMLSAQREYYESGRSCFPDVMLYDWFSAYICAARDQGVVKGFVDGKFHPEYTVTYGEALKMLTILFGYQSHAASGHWAEQYYIAATERGVDLPITIELDKPLTRGQAVRLAAAFFAESKGGLMALRLAEGGVYPSSSSLSSVSSSSSSRVSSSSSSSSSFPNRVLDPLTDSVVRSQFILLGETSPMIGAAKFFIEEEPLDVTAISVNLVSDVATVQSLLVYDDDRRYLGRATLNTATSSTNRNYRLEIPIGMFTLGKREDRSVYFRAQLASKDAGGIGQQSVQISNVTVQGNGGWSNRAYTKQSSGSRRGRRGCGAAAGQPGADAGAGQGHPAAPGGRQLDPVRGLHPERRLHPQRIAGQPGQHGQRGLAGRALTTSALATRRPARAGRLHLGCPAPAGRRPSRAPWGCSQAASDEMPQVSGASVDTDARHLHPALFGHGQARKSTGNRAHIRRSSCAQCASSAHHQSHGQLLCQSPNPGVGMQCSTT